MKIPYDGLNWALSLHLGSETKPQGDSNVLPFGQREARPANRTAAETLDYAKTASREEQNRNGMIRCYPSGVLINPFHPILDDIHIEDIAHSLALQTRYAGHCPEPYSIAQHCVRVSNRMNERAYYNEPNFRLAALLHDSEEAYFLDMPSPIKSATAMADYKKSAQDMRRTIFRKFDVDYLLLDHVKWSDNAEYFNERREMWPDDPADYVKPWTWGYAEIAFLKLFNELQYERTYGVAT